MTERKAVILLMFDLPSVSSEDRKEYYHFMKNLKKEGFLPLQESCYLKLVRNVSSIEPFIQALKAKVPRDGNVNVLPLPMSIFRGMQCILGQPFPMSLFSDDVFMIGEPDDEKSA